MNLLFIAVLSLLTVGYAMDPEEEAVEVEDLEIRGRYKGPCRKSPGSECRRRWQSCGKNMEICGRFRCPWGKKCCCRRPTPRPTKPTPEPSCPSGWTEFKSQCYFIVNKGKMNAFLGLYQCKKLGATLPIIKSAEENAFLQRLMARHGSTRLGMIAPNRNNVFEWLDGTSLAFSDWAYTEPNLVGQENCGMMYFGGGPSYNGKWLNDPCSTELSIVCQKEKK